MLTKHGCWLGQRQTSSNKCWAPLYKLNEIVSRLGGVLDDLGVVFIGLELAWAIIENAYNGL